MSDLNWNDYFDNDRESGIEIESKKEESSVCECDEKDTESAYCWECGRQIYQ